MPQDTLNNARGRTFRPRNQKSLHGSDGNSPHSHHKAKEESEEVSDQSESYSVFDHMSETKNSTYSAENGSSASSPSSLRPRRTLSKHWPAPKKVGRGTFGSFPCCLDISYRFILDRCESGQCNGNKFVDPASRNVNTLNQDHGLGYVRRRQMQLKRKIPLI
jgi:hypothetical protein